MGRIGQSVLAFLVAFIIFSIPTAIFTALYLSSKDWADSLVKADCQVVDIYTLFDRCDDVCDDDDDDCDDICFDAYVIMEVERDDKIIKVTAEINTNDDSEREALDEAVDECNSVGRIARCWYDPETINKNRVEERVAICDKDDVWLTWLVLMIISIILLVACPPVAAVLVYLLC
jgi:hypothetical protein